MFGIGGDNDEKDRLKQNMEEIKGLIEGDESGEMPAQQPEEGQEGFGGLSEPVENQENREDSGPGQTTAGFDQPPQSENNQVEGNQPLKSENNQVEGFGQPPQSGSGQEDGFDQEFSGAGSQEQPLDQNSPAQSQQPEKQPQDELKDRLQDIKDESPVGGQQEIGREEIGDLGAEDEVQHVQDQDRSRGDPEQRAPVQEDQEVEGEEVSLRAGASDLNDEIPDPPETKKIDVPDIEKGPLFIKRQKFESAVKMIQEMKQISREIDQVVNRLQKGIEQDRKTERDAKELLHQLEEDRTSVKYIVSPDED